MKISESILSLLVAAILLLTARALAACAASPPQAPATVTATAPGAWIVGELRTDEPDWRADYVVTDSSGSKITYGPEETVGPDGADQGCL